MTRWEYEKIDLNGLPRKTEEIDVLNDAGRRGWELVHITSNMLAYFKRQVAEPAPAVKEAPERSAKRSAARAPAS